MKNWQKLLSIFIGGVGVGISGISNSNHQSLNNQGHDSVHVTAQYVDPLILPGFATSIYNTFNRDSNHLDYWWTDSTKNGQIKYNSTKLAGASHTWDWGWKWNNTKYCIEFEVPYDSPFYPKDISVYTVIAFQKYVLLNNNYYADLSIYSTVAGNHVTPKFSDNIWTKTDVVSTKYDPFNVHGNIQFYATGNPYGTEMYIYWYDKHIQTFRFR